MTTEVMMPEQMSPESMRVIEAYLACGSDVKKAAYELGMSQEDFVAIYNKREVKNYLMTLFNESGFRNREKFFGILDTVLELKLEELQESGMGSSMDIMDILTKMHKMKMDEMKMQIELEKVQQAKGPSTQINVQNNYPGSHDPQYQKLMQSLASGKFS